MKIYDFKQAQEAKDRKDLITEIESTLSTLRELRMGIITSWLDIDKESYLQVINNSISAMILQIESLK